MTIKERFLNLIGLVPVTNRDMILMELAEVDGATFEHLVFSRMSDLPEAVEDLHCEDCRAAHGGRCPQPGDDECCYTVAQWLDEPCRRERLIGVIGG